MNPSTRIPLVGRWRQACAALLAGTSMAALLVACGGGGDAPAGAGTPQAQSFASGPITGLGSVIVNGVRFDDSAARVENDEDDSVHRSSELKLGMMVEIQAGKIDDNAGRASASLIRFGSEIVGPVASKSSDPAPAPQTLRVLDQTIEVKSTTVFEEGIAGFADIKLDQVLEIHALFDASTGRYVATRIEAEPGATANRLRGVVKELTAKTFKIGDALIDFSNVPAADVPANLANGQRVRVRLKTTQVVNGQWDAISVRTGVRKVDDIGDVRLRGKVTAYTSPQRFELQGIPVDASNASFEPNANAVVLGALVEVRGQASNGKIIASRVKVRDERDDDLQRVELHGTVSALSRSAKTFMVREVKVDYSRVLEWKNGASAELLADDKQVEVKGLWSDDRRVLFAVVIGFES